MKTRLEEIAGGALQEQFQRALNKVVENLQNPNTSYRNKREIIIKMGFTQNETRDDVKCSVLVSEKLAPQQSLETTFAAGKDIRTGETYFEEYGKQIRGQMSIDDFVEEEVETEEEEATGARVLDLRRKVQVV